MSSDGGTQPVILRKKQVSELLGGISAQTIMRMVKSGQFPPPSCHARRIALWHRDVITAWTRGGWRPEPGPKAAKARAERAKVEA
jgi:predicted DNA-binding transcriptional regulator AlpA